MAFTRFHDDECRIMKQNQQATDPGRWIIDVPGNGDRPCYVMDPHIIPQKWGANLWTNSVDVQSVMLGLDRRLNRDCIVDWSSNTRMSAFRTESLSSTYPVCDQFLVTDESRVSCPAWTFRDKEQVDWWPMILNPQENVMIPFRYNESSRVEPKLQVCPDIRQM